MIPQRQFVLRDLSNAIESSDFPLLGQIINSDKKNNFGDFINKKILHLLNPEEPVYDKEKPLDDQIVKAENINKIIEILLPKVNGLAANQKGVTIFEQLLTSPPDKIARKVNTLNGVDLKKIDFKVIKNFIGREIDKVFHHNKKILERVLIEAICHDHFNIVKALITNTDIKKFVINPKDHGISEFFPGQTSITIGELAQKTNQKVHSFISEHVV